MLIRYLSLLTAYGRLLPLSNASYLPVAVAWRRPLLARIRQSLKQRLVASFSFCHSDYVLMLLQLRRELLLASMLNATSTPVYIAMPIASS